MTHILPEQMPKEIIEQPTPIHEAIGSHFRNHIVDELLAALTTQHHCSTPYHSQTNGLQATTKETPFYLVYGRQARLPLYPSKSDDILNVTIIQRLYEIDHDLPEAYNNALYQISK
ncbi:1467_t:CDS:2, partial [Gigaspora rosea]